MGIESALVGFYADMIQIVSYTSTSCFPTTASRRLCRRHFYHGPMPRPAASQSTPNIRCRRLRTKRSQAYNLPVSYPSESFPSTQHRHGTTRPSIVVRRIVSRIRRGWAGAEGKEGVQLGLLVVGRPHLLSVPPVIYIPRCCCCCCCRRLMQMVLTWFQAARYLSMQAVTHFCSPPDNEEPGFGTQCSKQCSLIFCGWGKREREGRSSASMHSLFFI